MSLEATEADVHAEAEARGFALIPIPGDPGKYSLTRPPETTPLTDARLTLAGIQQWLQQH